MSALEKSESLFFNNSDTSPESAIKIVQDNLYGTDGGELYMEATYS